MPTEKQKAASRRWNQTNTSAIEAHKSAKAKMPVYFVVDRRFGPRCPTIDVYGRGEGEAAGADGGLWRLRQEPGEALLAMSDGYRWTQDDLKRHLGKLKRHGTAVVGDVIRPSAINAYLSSAVDSQAGNLSGNRLAVRPRKYRNTPVLRVFDTAEIVNGHLRLCHTFDSIREADYYAELVIRRQAGEIKDLRLQEPFALVIRTEKGEAKIVGEWLADAVFTETASGARVVSDAKGVRTPIYQLKKKIVEAYWQVTILEV